MPSTSRRRLVVLGEAEDSGSVGSRMFGRVALAGRRVHTHLATLTIEVDAAADLGPSHLGLLLGVHAPGMGSTGTTHDPVAEAWRAAGLNRWRGIWLFGDEGGGIRIVRSNGRLKLDWKDFAWVPDWVATYGTPIFNISPTPRELSFRPDHPEFHKFAPKYLDEWYTVVRAVVAGIRERFGVRGARYQVHNEPDDDAYYFYGWNPNPGPRSTYNTLNDYLWMYVHAARAVRDADNSARVGGPVTAHWNGGPGGMGFYRWGLPDFLERLGQLNRHVPRLAAPLDFCDWHDYAWTPGPSGYEPDLDVGRAFVRSQLDANGFQATRALVVSEWNASYYADPSAPSDQDRASHAAFNLIKQSSLARDPVSRAFLYAFDTTDEGFEGAVMVRADAGSGKLAVTPTHAVFTMLRPLATGRRVSTAAPDPLAAVAVRGTDGAIRVAVSNHTTTSRNVRVLLHGLPIPDGAVEGLVRFVDGHRSADGSGLESGTSVHLAVASGGAQADLDLPARSCCTLQIGA